MNKFQDIPMYTPEPDLNIPFDIIIKILLLLFILIVISIIISIVRKKLIKVKGKIMNEEKFEKTIKDLKWFSIILLGWKFIDFAILCSQIKIYSFVLVYFIIYYIIRMTLLMVTIIECNKKKIYGPIVGIIDSILLQFPFKMIIINAILGIACLIECISLIRYMSKDNKQK